MSQKSKPKHGICPKCGFRTLVKTGDVCLYCRGLHKPEVRAAQKAYMEKWKDKMYSAWRVING